QVTMRAAIVARVRPTNRISLMSTSQIVVLFGRPGVGKFTVGRELAVQTGFRLLHNHAVVDLVAALFEFGSEPFVALRERIWLDAVDAVLIANLPGLVLTFAPERTVPDSFLATLAARTREGGGMLRLVELRCGAGALEQRLIDPSRRQFGKLRDVDLFRRL